MAGNVKLLHKDNIARLLMASLNLKGEDQEVISRVATFGLSSDGSLDAKKAYKLFWGFSGLHHLLPQNGKLVSSLPLEHFKPKNGQTWYYRLCGEKTIVQTQVKADWARLRAENNVEVAFTVNCKGHLVIYSLQDDLIGVLP